MAVQDGEEFIVVDFTEATPEGGFSEKPQVSEQLAESHFRRHGPDLGQHDE
jgi:hypothetical protein